MRKMKLVLLVWSTTVFAQSGELPPMGSEPPAPPAAAPAPAPTPAVKTVAAPTSASTQNPPSALTQAALTKLAHLTEDTWDNWPGKFSQYIGYEGSGGFDVLGSNIVVYGWWKRDWATEFFGGINKSADTISASSSSTSNASSSSSTSSTSGAKNPYVITLGAGQNYRIAHPKWLQVYTGYFGGLTYTTGTSYSTGTITTTVASSASPNNYTINYSNYGTQSVSTDPLFFLGAKLGADFFVKWFPNLALGFTSGLMTTFGGKVTTTASTKTGTDTYTSGVAATPSPVNSTSSSTSANPGLRATTFGIGGTTFELTGAFTIRYVW